MIKSVLDIVLTLTFAIAIFFGLPKALSYFLKTSTPIAAITSGSMWPVLKQNDLILIKKIEDTSKIAVGDIVVYKNENGFTVHRVVRKLTAKLITRGDANNVDDSPIAYNQVEGKVLGTKTGPVRLPFLGKISTLLQQLHHDRGVTVVNPVENNND